MSSGPIRQARLNPTASFRTRPQGNAVLVFDTGQAFEVDGIGLTILRSLDACGDVAALIEELASQYAADRNAVACDVYAFLRDCAELGVVCLPDDEDEARAH